MYALQASYRWVWEFSRWMPNFRSSCFAPSYVYLSSNWKLRVRSSKSMLCWASFTKMRRLDLCSYSVQYLINVMVAKHDFLKENWCTENLYSQLYQWLLLYDDEATSVIDGIFFYHYHSRQVWRPSFHTTPRWKPCPYNRVNPTLKP